MDTLNSWSGSGRGTRADARGNTNNDMHILAMGMNLSQASTSVNVMLGGILNPSNGSSSTHEVNMGMWAKLITPLRPPGKKK